MPLTYPPTVARASAGGTPFVPFRVDQETILFPGFDGGMEWGGGAADPDGIYYVNINEIPWLMQMVETRRADGTSVPSGERNYMAFCAPCHGLDRAGNPLGGFPSLIDVGARKPREQVSLITRQGAGRMPAFDQLADVQRNAAVDRFTVGRVHAEHVVVAHGEVAAEIVRRDAGVDVVRGVDVQLAVEHVRRRVGDTGPTVTTSDRKKRARERAGGGSGTLAGVFGSGEGASDHLDPM
jgi:mono/diheme cytochrome c family protein